MPLTISQVVEQLQALQIKHGDIPVGMRNAEFNSVDTVEAVSYQDKRERLSWTMPKLDEYAILEFEPE